MLLAQIKKALQIKRNLVLNSSRFAISRNFGTGRTGGNNRGSSWGLPLTAVGIGGLGYFYLFKEKKISKDSENPRSPLDLLKPLPFTPQVVFVLGGPGAGKGTQCSKLVQEFGFNHLSAGDLLRAERKRPGSKYGDLINSYIEEGKIVPMEITIALLHAVMLKEGKKSQKFLIDGFPRQMDQALKFEEKVAECSFVLYFECPEKEMLARLIKRGETSGRVDDNVDSIMKRFDTFRKTSFPVIQYYEKLHKVRQVGCLASVDQVYEKTKTFFN